ncbi:uncharacterized protein J3D65DRAFT_28026 [Phyllosticta citribraziliensis]|uniref:Uncharacterized protein n=1 Tax=Phyllosticta citribraziliensis TaxID=989973 RepID=A0ABR1M9Q3_9PEZI
MLPVPPRQVVNRSITTVRPSVRNRSPPKISQERSSTAVGNPLLLVRLVGSLGLLLLVIVVGNLLDAALGDGGRLPLLGVCVVGQALAAAGVVEAGFLDGLLAEGLARGAGCGARGVRVGLAHVGLAAGLLVGAAVVGGAAGPRHEGGRGVGNVPGAHGCGGWRCRCGGGCVSVRVEGLVRFGLGEEEDEIRL